MAARVTIILPFYNADRFLDETIESVRAQTFQDWRLLLLDDGASDRSTGIARRHAAMDSRIEYSEHPGHANYGAARTRNIGLERATGDYVAFIDADDVWLPHKLAEQVALLDTHPSAAYTYGPLLRWYSWAGGTDILQDVVIPAGTVTVPPAPLALFITRQEAAPTPSTWMIRTALAARLGGFENEWGIEDLAFLTKLAVNGAAIVSDRCSVKYRQHPEAISSVLYAQGRHGEVRRIHVTWVARYVESMGVRDRETVRTVRRELRRITPRHPAIAAVIARVKPLLGPARWQRVRKAFLR